MDDIPMSIIVHYNGEWKYRPKLEYVRGMVKMFDNLPDDMDATYFRTIIDGLGCNDIIKLHYCDPFTSIDTGVRFLCYDVSIFAHFLSVLRTYRVLDVFTEHENQTKEGFINLHRNLEAFQTSIMEDCNKDYNDHIYEEQVTVGQQPLEDIQEVDYDEEGSDNEDDEVREARQKMKTDKKHEIDLLTEIRSIERLAKRNHQHNFQEDGSDYDSDNFFDSPDCSDEDDCGHLIAEQRQQFEDAIEFRKAVTNYCVSQGRDVHFSRNDKNRIGARCKAKDKGCPWYIWASTEKGKGTIVVKILISQHNCGRLPTIKKVKASWVAGNYHSKFKVNPYLKCQEIVDTIWTEYGIKKWKTLTVAWGWFLQLLADDLGTFDGSGYTIMSDQQKGLLKAVSLVWPKAETRCCARHVYCNFRQVFGRGLQYRRGFWKVAKSTTENEFKVNMELFSTINVAAGQDLLKRNYQKWFPLEPLNGPSEWPQSAYAAIQAPPVKKIINRPTLKRKPSMGENEGIKLSKKGEVHKCSNCGEGGHNKSNCCLPRKEQAPKQKQARTGKQTTTSKTTAKAKQIALKNPHFTTPTQHSETLFPMHYRGFGVYTYPSGYQRQAVMDDIPMSIIVHYNGKWKYRPKLEYVGGMVKVFDNLPDDMDATYFRTIIDGLGCNDIIKLHYCDPFTSIDTGVRFLCYDVSIFAHFLSVLRSYRVLDVFTEHENQTKEGFINLHSNLEAFQTSIMEDCNKDYIDHIYEEQVTVGQQPLEDIQEVDYDEEGSDNEDDEVREARQKMKTDKKHEIDLLTEIRSIERLAKRNHQHNFQEDGSDYDSDNFLYSPDCSDEDDCGHLIAEQSKTKRKKVIKASWVAENYHSKFKVNPYLKCQEIVDTIWTEYGINVSLWLALKAKRKAQQLILGPFGGQVLVAVGRDGNNQMFPIAWACVKVEDTDSWGWFLQLLADDLGTFDGSCYTIMSDKQKGLLKAVSLVWPKAETNCCARHVYCNLRQVFGGGLQYRRGFWKVAKSTTENEFKVNMELFSTINVAAAIWKAMEHPEHYVANWFTKDTYLRAYQFPLEPLNGPSEWPQSAYAAIQAPPVKKIMNRPTLKRKPSMGENEGIKLSKKGEFHKCSNCGEGGHNKRNCTLPRKEQAPKQKQAPTGKQTTTSKTTAKAKQIALKNPHFTTPTQHSETLFPMHYRGFGVYTYPSGYQRQDVMDDIPMSIIVHYNGKWKYRPKLEYVGGMVKVFDNLPDDMDATYFRTIIDGLGCNDIIKLHYCDPFISIDTGVQFLRYDVSIFAHFLSVLRTYRVLDVFTEHENQTKEGFINLHSNLEAFQTSIMEDCNKDYNDHIYEEQVTVGQQPLEDIQEVDYDEEGSDNEDDEVREARQKMKNDKKHEIDLLTEIRSIERLAKRNHQHNFQEEGSDYDSDNFLDSPDCSDEDDCGHLIAEQPKPKRKKVGGMYTLVEMTKTELVQGVRPKTRDVHENYHSKFKVNPYLKCQEIVDTIWTENGIKVSLWLALKARRKAQQLILVSLVWPKAETRCCARHVYYNFRQVFGGGLQYRRGFWKVAKSTTENEFKVNMELFSTINVAAAIWKAMEHPEHYVANWFTKDTYLRAYQFPLEPLNGPSEWPQSAYAAIQAPPVKKIMNRPTLKRKPSMGENEGIKLPKKGEVHKCSNCGEGRHNKRNCTLPRKEQAPKQKQAPTGNKQQLLRQLQRLSKLH
ncbi:Transposase for insertion sequence element IS905 [Bienertia sinuspersici]